MSEQRSDHASEGSEPDLVVLSHLRWDWVWQRPQHLISRLASGRRVWFVEEPVVVHDGDPRLEVLDTDTVTRVRLLVPSSAPGVYFEDAAARDYSRLLRELVGDDRPDVWLYTPMALDIAEDLDPGLVVYDVMDDLGSFADAPTGYQLKQRRALDRAHVVFTGGRSLYRSAIAHRADGVYLFPSGVETTHYATSRELRTDHDVPVAGYVGVIDERLDLQLVADLAAALPDWRIEMAGPVTKIDEATLPQAPNLRYLGMQPYERLPQVMAGFDVALMPFAMNEATRSISPTKTLEYLAAGLPVVSTRVPDVVTDFGSVVHLADDGVAFAAACRHVVDHCRETRDTLVAPIARRHEWDAIAADMAALMAAARSGSLVDAGDERQDTA